MFASSASRLVLVGSLFGVSALLSAGCSSKSEAPVAPADTKDSGPACTPPGDPEGDDCTSPLTPGTDRKCKFTFNGKSREFLIYAPASYDPCKPSAVVFDAHGATETAAAHAGLEQFRTFPKGLGSGWRLVADRENFVVVTPQGIANLWAEADVDFIFEIHKKVTAVTNVDAEKVFFTGISNGAFLSYWVGCRDAGIFKGFAPISGQSNKGACALKNKAPLIGFHAKEDSVIEYAAGLEAATDWAKSLHCKSGPTNSITYGGPSADDAAICLESGANSTPPWTLAACSKSAMPTTCKSWSGCDEGKKVTFCTLDSADQPVGGHILYFNNTKLSLAAAAWEYFKGL